MDVNNANYVQTQGQQAGAVRTPPPAPSPAPAPVAADVEMPALAPDVPAPGADVEMRHILHSDEISDSMMEQAFIDANRVLSGIRLTYDIHEPTSTVMVRVYDDITNEVIREIPPESKLDIYARITEFTGLLFDRTS